MDSLYDVLRRYEFNKTEPETLQELVRKAIEKGNIAQQEIENLGRASRKIAMRAEEVGLVLVRPMAKEETIVPPLAVIDGNQANPTLFQSRIGAEALEMYQWSA